MELLAARVPAPAGVGGLIRRVISGGQYGADVAGLRAAMRLGLETGGWMPEGYRTVGGPRPEYAAMYGVRCAPSPDYPLRTSLNVRESDATVRLAWDWKSYGEQATLRELRKAGKPHIDATLTRLGGGIVADILPDDLRRWIEERGVQVLNVAGNSSYWIEEFVEEYLMEALV